MKKLLKYTPGKAPTGEDLVKVQDAVESWGYQFASCPFITGGQSVSVAIPAGATYVVAHKLGRTPIGWFVIDQYHPSSISYTEIMRTAWDDKTITIVTDGGGAGTVVTLWVF